MKQQTVPHNTIALDHTGLGLKHVTGFCETTDLRDKPLTTLTKTCYRVFAREFQRARPKTGFELALTNLGLQLAWGGGLFVILSV